MKKILKHPLIKYETKRNVFVKFVIVVIVVLIYLFFTIYQYGLNQGFIVTILTWSFFVLCTPVANAGFLLAFPIRLLTKIKMFYSQIFISLLALIINTYMILFNGSFYERTFILKLFKEILLTPFPFWSIIILSILGTLMSVYFGDELIDTIRHSQRKTYMKHKKKHQFIMTLFIILIIFFIYYYLLNKLGIRLI